MADCKDFLVSEVIITGSKKENWECSDPSHLRAYNMKGSMEFPGRFQQREMRLAAVCGMPGQARRGHMQPKGSRDENGVSFWA